MKKIIGGLALVCIGVLCLVVLGGVLVYSKYSRNDESEDEGEKSSFTALFNKEAVSDGEDHNFWSDEELDMGRSSSILEYKGYKLISATYAGTQHTLLLYGKNDELYGALEDKSCDFKDNYEIVGDSLFLECNTKKAAKYFVSDTKQIPADAAYYYSDVYEYSLKTGKKVGTISMLPMNYMKADLGVADGKLIIPIKSKIIAYDPEDKSQKEIKYWGENYYVYSDENNLFQVKPIFTGGDSSKVGKIGVYDFETNEWKDYDKVMMNNEEVEMTKHNGQLTVFEGELVLDVRVSTDTYKNVYHYLYKFDSDKGFALKTVLTNQEYYNRWTVDYTKEKALLPNVRPYLILKRDYIKAAALDKPDQCNIYVYLGYRLSENKKYGYVSELPKGSYLAKTLVRGVYWIPVKYKECSKNTSVEDKMKTAISGVYDKKFLSQQGSEFEVLSDDKNASTKLEVQVSKIYPDIYKGKLYSVEVRTGDYKKGDAVDFNKNDFDIEQQVLATVKLYFDYYEVQVNGKMIGVNYP